MYGALHAPESSPALFDVARDFTPRFEICDPRTYVLDLSGLARLFGSPHALATELRRAAAERQVRVRVAIAGTYTAARLLAVAGSGRGIGEGIGDWGSGIGKIVVIEPGAEAAAVAPLLLKLLVSITNENDPNDSNDPNDPNDPNDLLSTFRRWGLQTLGDLAALPADAVAARLGVDGVRWHRLARGEDPRPLRPAVPEERFEQALDLEWPIEGLEPLSFVLGRLLDPLAAHLERRGRGAAVLHLRLHLVSRAVHERSLQLPAPMREARTLRTLLLLDLESHPPGAAIDRVVVAVEPTPARVLQFSLLARPLPSPDQLSTLTARLTALMGEGRCGSPAAIDSWQPGAFAMTPFNPDPSRSPIPDPRSPSLALRRFRVPVPARVRAEDGRPLHVTTDRVAMRPDQPALAKRSAFADRGGLSGGVVQRCAGPWRTSGHWWTNSGSGIGDRGSEMWDRDEWDVALSDGATYRVFRARATAAWFFEGIYD